MRAGRIVQVVALIALSCGVEAMGSDLEQSICGLKEPVYFWLWSRAAGSANPDRVRGRADVEDVAIETKDGRTLRGYKLQATPSVAERSYLLVAQGNAMLADQIILAFQPFADAGFDVFVLDYRGYGRSDGRRRLKAMLSDYREIIAALDRRGYASRAFYGMSFGGIVLLDALRDDAGGKAVVIDSSPSRLSDHGCPPQHDPVRNFPVDGSSALVIVGVNDTVVSPQMSRELVREARKSGATVIVDPEFGHPFTDGRTERRFATVRMFLEQHLNRVSSSSLRER